MMRSTLVLLGTLLCSLPAVADEPPFPSGLSEQSIEGMTCFLAMPEGYDAAREHSLLIALHGKSGDARGVAAGFADLAREDIVVCAPLSAGDGWDQPNLEKTRRVLAHLLTVLNIGAGRLHGAAFSQGGGFLASLVFDAKFRFASACWAMSGCTGGKVPPRAKKEMGVIALVGGEDWARGAAEGTVGMLEKKVRTVECHVQPGIGHEYPSALMGFYRAWLLIMDGRFVPGECPTFAWAESPDAAREEMARSDRPGLVYVYSTAEAEAEETRRVQEEVLFAPLARHFGRGAVALKLDRAARPELLEELGIEETPAVVVLNPDFTVDKALAGRKLTGNALAKALRAVAKDKRPPEKPGVHVLER